MSTHTPPAPPPPPKRGRLKWVFIGCGAIILLLALAGVGIYWGVSKATADPEKAVKEFLAAAAAGDYQAAHNYFSAPLKEVQPYDAFVSAASTQPQFFDITHTSFTNRSIDNNGAALEGNVTLRSGTKVPANFKLVKENDQWKLIAYNIGS